MTLNDALNLSVGLLHSQLLGLHLAQLGVNEEGHQPKPQQLKNVTQKPDPTRPNHTHGTSDTSEVH